MTVPIQYESVWGGLVPPDGPVGVIITLGYVFTCDVDGQFVGFRWYQQAGSHGVVLGQLWDQSGLIILARSVVPQSLVNTNDAADGWRTMWCHPRAPIVAGASYLAALTFWIGGGVYRWDNKLSAGDYVNGHLTVPSIAFDGNDGGRYQLPEDPSNPPSGSTWNLYAVDVLVDVS